MARKGELVHTEHKILDISDYIVDETSETSDYIGETE